jgi:hypothetical protein
MVDSIFRVVAILAGYAYRRVEVAHSRNCRSDTKFKRALVFLFK